MAQRRAATEKAKAVRARSWAKNQQEKAERIKDNEKRAAHNREVGTTGKQRDNQMRKTYGSKYREAKRAKQN